MSGDYILNIYSLQEFGEYEKNIFMNMYNDILKNNVDGYTRKTLYDTLVRYEILIHKDQLEVYKRDKTIDNVLDE